MWPHGAVGVFPEAIVGPEDTKATSRPRSARCLVGPRPKAVAVMGDCDTWPEATSSMAVFGAGVHLGELQQS